MQAISKYTVIRALESSYIIFKPVRLMYKCEVWGEKCVDLGNKCAAGNLTCKHYNKRIYIGYSYMIMVKC